MKLAKQYSIILHDAGEERVRSEIERILAQGKELPGLYVRYFENEIVGLVLFFRGNEPVRTSPAIARYWYRKAEEFVNGKD